MDFTKYLGIFLISGMIAVGLGCRWFVRPPDRPVLVEQLQGNYTYEDSVDSYSGRFLLISDAEHMAVDLYGPFHMLVTAIRHEQDSTVVYMPIQGQVLILGPDDLLPFEGWNLRVSALEKAYRGYRPSKPDSLIEGDTLVLYEGDLIYHVSDNRLLRLEGPDWSLVNQGVLEGHRPSTIIFNRGDMELSFEFTSIEIKEGKPGQVFSLNLPDGVERLDYR